LQRNWQRSGLEENMVTQPLCRISPVHMDPKAWGKKGGIVKFVVSGQIRHVLVAKCTSAKVSATGTTTGRDLHP
jgi:hypothetical protein